MAETNWLNLQPEQSNEDFDQSPQTIDNTIGRCSARNITYHDFFWQYMHKNLPIILTDVSADWECRRNWIMQNNHHNNNNNDNNINFDYLRKKIGNQQVPIANCSIKYFNSHEKSEMTFYGFLDYWQSKIADKNDVINSNIITTDYSNSNNLYLKDWHLKSQLPDYEFYNVPKHFASDWLNEYLVNNQKDDYRFVYMGPQDSWTPFHADVFGSYSWSTNILGCKKWILLPPNEEEKLLDRLGNLPFSIDETQLQKNNVKFFTIHQRENEAIFVPSGWYHQVWNLTDTISINHNWFNACNVQSIWKNLSINMKLVIAEIDDCRQMDNFDDHCQTMLRASFGLNYLDFLNIIEFIGACRLQHSSSSSTLLPDNLSSKSLLYAHNDFHRRYDLASITNVLKGMLQDSVVCNNRTEIYRRCLKLLESLKETKNA